MFEKSLTDVIRGVRANKDVADEYIQQCINECRREVAVPNDKAVNAQAVLKLAYFHMMGYDMSWASFHVLKVMAMQPLCFKWIGYLAASVSFSPKTDVLMLTTNQIKKDLASNNHQDTSVAVACLSEIVTHDLAGDLSMDLVTKINHFSPYTRRRVLLAIYRTSLVYPDIMEMCKDRLTDLLEDDDPSVVTCAVSVICELANTHAKEYISLAPQLFGLLTTVSNNWMLIKLVKMFSRLSQLEPRLIKKLAGPLAELIHSTSAMSLLYECVLAAISGRITDPTLNPSSGLSLAKLCLTKLLPFLSSQDPNLRYVGLVATEHLLRAHSDLGEAVEELVFECLDSRDETIQHKAMDVLSLLVNQENLPDVVEHLLTRADKRQQEDHEQEQQQGEATLADGALAATGQIGTNPWQSAALGSVDRKTMRVVLEMCTRDTFGLVQDFEWLVSTFARLLASNAVLYVAKPLAKHLITLAMRVVGLRAYMLTTLTPLLAFEGHMAEESAAPLVSAIIWIVGEYVGYAHDASNTLQVLFDIPIQKLPSTLHPIYTQAIVKVALFNVVALLEKQEKVEGDPKKDESQPGATKIISDVTAELRKLASSSSNLEAVERVHIALRLFDKLTEAKFAKLLLREVFECYLGAELVPIDPSAHNHVQPPFDLDDWISADAQTFFDSPAEPIIEPPSPETVSPAAPSFDDAMERPLGQAQVSEEQQLAPASTEVSNQVKRDRVQELQGSPFYVRNSRAKQVLRKNKPASSLSLMAPQAKYQINRGNEGLTGMGEGSSGYASAVSPVMDLEPVLATAPVGSSKGASAVGKGNETPPPMKPRAAKSKKRMWIEEVEQGNEDFSLTVQLSAPRAPSAGSGAGGNSWMVPVSLVLAPIDSFFSLSESSQIHVSCPAWIKHTGLREDNTVLQPGTRLSEAIQKLVLFKLRKSKAMELFANPSSDDAIRDLTLGFRVLQGEEMAFRIEFPLTPIHIMEDAAPITPDEFESKLTSESRNEDFGYSKSADVNLDVPEGKEPVKVAMAVLSRSSRLKVVEHIGASATLWGYAYLPSGPSNIAGMAKIALKGSVATLTVEVKGREEWLVNAVADSISGASIIPLDLDAS